MRGFCIPAVDQKLPGGHTKLSVHRTQQWRDGEGCGVVLPVILAMLHEWKLPGAAGAAVCKACEIYHVWAVLFVCGASLWVPL